MLRVLHITNTYPHFKKMEDGKQVLVPEGFYVHSQVKSLRKYTKAEVYFINGYYNKFNYLKAIWYVFLLNFSRESKYDVIHAHYGISGFIARFQLRYKLVISFCGSDVLGTPTASGGKSFLGKIVVLMSKLAHKFCDASITKTEEMAAILKEPQCVVIPNGVDFDNFRPLDRNLCRYMAGFDSDKKVILFLGNEHSLRKRYDLAKDSVNMLNEKTKKAILYKGYGVHHSQIPVLMNASNVLLVTSDWEGSINIVKEAMACNLPIVSVDVGDVKRIIESTEGCYISKRDKLDISDKLIRSLDIDRTVGRENISELNSEVISKRIVNIYEKL